MNRIKIATFDPKPLLRTGVVHVLNGCPDMEVIVHEESLANALETIRVCAPHVVIIDDTLLRVERESVRSLSIVSAIHMLVLASALSEEQVIDGLSVGVKGYIFPGASEHELLTAVRAVARGEGYVSPALAADLMLKQSRINKGNEEAPLSQLSHRETQIYRMLAGGHKNKEIGSRLNLTEKSVKRYVTIIFEKLNVRNRVEAAMLSNVKHKSDAQEQLVQITARSDAKPVELIYQMDGLDLQTGFETAHSHPKLALHQFSLVFGRARLPAPVVSSDLSAGTHILLKV